MPEDLGSREQERPNISLPATPSPCSEALTPTDGDSSGRRNSLRARGTELLCGPPAPSGQLHRCPRQVLTPLRPQGPRLCRWCSVRGEAASGRPAGPVFEGAFPKSGVMRQVCTPAAALGRSIKRTPLPPHSGSPWTGLAGRSVRCLGRVPLLTAPFPARAQLRESASVRSARRVTQLLGQPECVTFPRRGHPEPRGQN